ncbi:MAG: hypothetical protein AAFP98_09625 [Pseudomonadota bacterium]
MSDQDALPVRDTPQEAVPHTEADPSAPFQGSAVALDVVTQ